ncbi:hypothetical protein WICPIJ_000143 [Wickerhamomyces pijperi]|uniref:Thioredoxin domain-containing protein n=1 Tax=Wickerhamomyces pijperi TaxID=599730 RepID=A0A9P8QEE5_WICPI|nr:hypothetical protein WICPIJ_000143 [Wickerhamomyces pijperi]
MAPTVLKSSEELSKLLKNPLVVLYFTATWCGPCKAIAPAIEQLSNQHATTIEIVKIDLDQFKSIAGTYTVTSVPTFIFLNAGKEVDRVIGADFNKISGSMKDLQALNPQAVKIGAASTVINAEEMKEIKGYIGKGASVLNGSVFFNDFESLNGVKVKDGSKNVSDLIRANPEDKTSTAIMTDADSQLLLHVPLSNASKIHSILIKSKTTTEDSQKPNLIKVWPNRTSIITFDEAESNNTAAHKEEIDQFEDDWVEIKLKLVKFQKVTALDIFIDGEDEDLNTVLDRVLIVDFRNVTWQFFDLSGVELFDFSQHVDIVVGDKVDGSTLSTETTTSTDSVDVVFLVGWQVVVDNQGDLLDIDTSGQQIGGDQDSGGTGSELLHDGVSFLLGQVGVDGRNGVLVLGQLFGQEFDFSSDDLGGFWQQSENVVDLFLETSGQHFIGFIQDEHLDLVGSEETTVNHVEDSTWGTDDDLSTVLQGFNVVLGGGTTDGGVDSDVQVGTNGQDNLLDLQGQFSGWG